jgi:miniconductance mechanosensitive channel
VLTSLREWLGPFEKVFLRMAHFAPAFVIGLAGTFMFPVAQSGGDPFPYLNTFQTCGLWVARAGLAYSSLVLMLVALAIVDGYRTRLQLQEGAVEGIIRAVRRGILLTGLVLIFASLAGRNPMYFVGGLGAFMAVLILSFRDTILGLVASIQIVSAKMLKEGDWIQMPGRGVDGTVLGITLNAVTVENFDKTVTTIPTHTLLSESFKKVETSEGRRIKRAILIDMHSIKPCTPEMIERYAKIDLLGEYIPLKMEELKEENLGVDAEGSVLNSRRLTNLGTFRAYTEAYLAKHTELYDEDKRLRLVRQLDPGTLGLPVEVYAFCIETDFKKYEAVQADIFDHLLSILPEFELRAFQNITAPDAVS